MREQLIRQRVEKTVAWLTLAFTIVGLAEKTNHYVKLAQKTRTKKKHPLGFHP